MFVIPYALIRYYSVKVARLTGDDASLHLSDSSILAVIPIVNWIWVFRLKKQLKNHQNKNSSNNTNA